MLLRIGDRFVNTDHIVGIGLAGVAGQILFLTTSLDADFMVRADSAEGKAVIAWLAEVAHDLTPTPEGRP